MLIMALVPSGHLWWSIALSGVVTAERVLERPLRATRRHAVAFATAAAIAGGVGAIR